MEATKRFDDFCLFLKDLVYEHSAASKMIISRALRGRNKENHQKKRKSPKKFNEVTLNTAWESPP